MNCLEAHRDIGVHEVVDRRGNAFQLDERAFHANVEQVRRLLPPGTKIYQCAKGDGYGVGVERIVCLGVRAGVDGFCLGTPEEALRAKCVAAGRPVLLFAGCDPAALGEMVEAGIIVSISSVEGCEALLRSGATGDVFFKLDCGFRRYGLNEPDLRTVLDRVRRQSSVRCIGAYSHFGSRADEIVDGGLPLFDRLTRLIEDAVQRPIETMVASSTLILQRPGLGHSAVDPGRLLYGMMAAGPEMPPFQPIVPRISSRLLQVTPFDEARLLTVGYADKTAIPAGGATGVFPLGWIDGLSAHRGFGEVLIRGTRLSVVARTLQHSIVNLSGLSDVRVGDEVVLVGAQGDEQIGLEAMASAQGMSVTEAHFRLLAAIAAGVPNGRQNG
ncbi:alanine racemase [Rhizorhabdus wittichii]|uniref:alanine racemase n=1 Tax=Rhizorhabdus wittichii TaxID=160791 RepID=UPI00030E8912|nr:alanine racemase [Rhizorhabdus wittichii]